MAQYVTVGATMKNEPSTVALAQYTTAAVGLKADGTLVQGYNKTANGLAGVGVVPTAMNGLRQIVALTGSQVCSDFCCILI